MYYTGKSLTVKDFTAMDAINFSYHQ